MTKLVTLLASLVLVTGANAQTWPIAPIDRPHGVYGTFANSSVRYDSTRVRSTSYLERDVLGFLGYHVGIDIPVNDGVNPEGTPVYSMRQGTVVYYGTTGEPSDNCWLYRMEIAHNDGGFIYGHISPTVSVGDEVRQGQLIGYTCPGVWHLHLGQYDNVGEYIRYVNPLNRLPFDDLIPPRIVRLNKYLFSAGIINVSVLTDDPQSLKDWDTAPTDNLHVQSLRVKVYKRGVLLSNRLLFTLDRKPNRLLKEHFDLSRTSRNMPVYKCAVAPVGTNCNGAYWLRLWPNGWKVRAGVFKLKLEATDRMGNRTVKEFSIRVR